MKNKTHLFLLAILAVMSVPAYSVVLDVDTDVDLKYASAYVWRGEVLNDEAVIQPSATIGAGNFSLNIWGTWDLTDVENSSDYTRMDVALDYTYISGPHMLRPGIVSYIYYDAKDGDSKDTFEATLDYTFDVLLLPTLSFYYDFAEIDGFYTTFSLTHGFTLVENEENQPAIDMDFKVLVGAAGENYSDSVFGREAASGVEAFEPDGSSLVDLVAKISFPMTISDHAVLTPEARYTMLLDSDIRDALDERDEDQDQFLYSVTLGVRF